MRFQSVNPLGFLKEPQIGELCELYVGGTPIKDLATKYTVSESTILRAIERHYFGSKNKETFTLKSKV